MRYDTYNMWINLKIKLETSPLVKTIIGIFSLIIFSVLSGAFVTELTHDGSIVWSDFYKAKSFYGLVLGAVLMYFYFRLQLGPDETVDKFRDDEYCKAYMRKQCLPELAKKINTSLKKAGDADGTVRDILKI